MFVLATAIVAAIPLSLPQFISDEPKPFSPGIVEAWEKAGAEPGRITMDKSKIILFQSGSPKGGELPAFRVSKTVKLSDLPAPNVPFGLVCESITDVGVKQLATLKQLQTLDLSGTDVTDAGVKNLAALKLKQLETLNLSETQVTDAGVKALAGLKLKTLALPILAHTDLGLKNYLAAIDPPTKLDLEYWRISDAGLKELAALKQLQSLDLSFTEVTDAGMKELSGLKQLQSLNLGYTQATDGCVKELAVLKQLQTLNMSGTELTDAGMKELSAFKQLQELDLRDTEVTGAGVKELRKALPKCKVISNMKQPKAK